MGTEPLEEEIPADEEDLADESRLALQIFRYLPDTWSSMSGHYLGKELTSLNVIFSIFDIKDKHLKRFILLVVKLLDMEVSEIVSSRIKNEAEASKAKAGGKRGR